MSANTANRKPLYDATHDVIDKAEEKMFDSMERARSAGEEFIDKAGVAEEHLQQAASKAHQSLGQSIKDKPLQTAGIAFTAGVLTTLILSRSKS